jgi:S-adenosylmethionine:tRNA ribosyltransferase-isomerase
VTITLHVGAGTFAPVRAQNIQDHVMHREWYNVGADAASAIMAAKKRGGRVIGVGTTVARALESAANRNGGIDAACGDTQIFITPGYDFKLVDMMVTNFHLPQSTLLMMVAAFVGYDRMREIYAHAMAQKYRFYSYGDACLLFKNHPLSAPVGMQSGH